LILFCVAGSVAADKTVRYDNAKTFGLGNTKVAGGFGYNGFIDNPALLSRVELVRFSIVNLPLTLNKNFIDIAKFIQDNSDKFKNYNDLPINEKTQFIKDIQEYDGEWARVKLSPMLDVTGNFLSYGVGFAVFSTENLNMEMDQGIYEPRVWGEGNSTTAVVFGVAKPLFILVPGLTIGANVKYMRRYHADLFQIPASKLGNLQNTIKPITDKLKESKNNTFAVDIGGLLEIPFINSEIGASIQSIGDGRGSSVDLGFAKRILDDKLVILADYLDLLDNNKENVFNKIHVGTEFNYYFFAVRAGLNSGYPTVGIGLDFHVIDIDAAYYTEELSKGPGGYAEPRFIAQVKLGW
jgi:hypothetical protein